MYGSGRTRRSVACAGGSSSMNRTFTMETTFSMLQHTRWGQGPQVPRGDISPYSRRITHGRVICLRNSKTVENALSKGLYGIPTI